MRSYLSLALPMLVLASACGGDLTSPEAGRRTQPKAEPNGPAELTRMPLEMTIGPLVNGHDFQVERRLDLYDGGKAAFTARIVGSAPAETQQQGQWRVLGHDGGSITVELTFDGQASTVTLLRTAAGLTWDH